MTKLSRDEIDKLLEKIVTEDFILQALEHANLLPEYTKTYKVQVVASSENYNIRELENHSGYSLSAKGLMTNVSYNTMTDKFDTHRKNKGVYRMTA